MKRRVAAAWLLAALLAAALAPAAMAGGTKITARGSQFGKMLWGPNRKAVYIFQRDKRGKSRCYSECAEAWPPLYTSGRPVGTRSP